MNRPFLYANVTPNLSLMRPLSFYNTVSVCIRVPLDNLLQTVLEFYSLRSYMYVHVSKITPFKDVFMVILLVNFIF